MNGINRKLKLKIFKLKSLFIRIKGYNYAICSYADGCCYRLHKVGCFNMLPKRRKIKGIVYLKDISDYDKYRGNILRDIDYLECQGCFK